jgi:hypothetical protein
MNKVLAAATAAAGGPRCYRPKQTPGARSRARDLGLKVVILPTAARRDHRCRRGAVSHETPENSISVVKVFYSKMLAQQDVDRLNNVNSEKGCRYVLQVTRLIPALN